MFKNRERAEKVPAGSSLQRASKGGTGELAKEMHFSLEPRNRMSKGAGRNGELKIRKGMRISEIL